MTERHETMLRLVLWRKRMTQADLARRTGIDPASVSRIVRGVEPAYPRRGRRIAEPWAGRATQRSCSRRCPMAKIVRAVPSAVLPDLLTVEQMAEMLGLSTNTVRSLCRNGQIPAVHIGRRWYVPRAKLDELTGVA